MQRAIQGNAFDFIVWDFFIFVFEVRKSDWVFELDEKIGKYFREEQRASRLGEKAAAVLTLPHKCQCHMRDQHC